jgi:hypothetical protein
VWRPGEALAGCLRRIAEVAQEAVHHRRAGAGAPPGQLLGQVGDAVADPFAARPLGADLDRLWGTRGTRGSSRPLFDLAGVPACRGQRFLEKPSCPCQRHPVRGGASGVTLDGRAVGLHKRFLSPQHGRGGRSARGDLQSMDRNGLAGDHKGETPEIAGSGGPSRVRGPDTYHARLADRLAGQIGIDRIFKMSQRPSGRSGRVLSDPGAVAGPFPEAMPAGSWPESCPWGCNSSSSAGSGVQVMAELELHRGSGPAACS